MKGGEVIGTDEAVPSKAWWQSRTIIGVAVMLLSQLLKRWNVDVVDSEVTDILTTLLDAVGAFLAIYGRINARQALKLTVPGGRFNPRAEVRRAKRADRGAADWDALMIVALIFVLVGLFFCLPRSNGAEQAAREIPTTELVSGRPAGEWLLRVPVEDSRPFLTRLFASLRATPTFVIVKTSDGVLVPRIERIEITGRADW